MKFYATLKGQKEPKEIDVQPLPNGHYAVTLDGKKHKVDALGLPHGAVSLIIDGHSHAIEFEEHADEVAVLHQGHVTRVDIVDERRARLRAASGGFGVEGPQTLLAPMPGKVVRVLVKPGDAVTEGQPVVVVEAMKMENELKAPRTGKVTDVSVKEGQTVENGAKLAVIE